MPSAYNISCAQLTRDLLAIAKFLLSCYITAIISYHYKAGISCTACMACN